MCVQARAREDKHYKAVNAERELELPMASLDYGQFEDTVEGAPAERIVTAAGKPFDPVGFSMIFSTSSACSA